VGAVWFVDVDGQSKGPLTPGQLRELALKKRILPQTRVRKGADGRWVQAGQVRGLFEDPGVPAGDAARPAQRSEQPADEDAADTKPTTLVPVRNVKVRLLVLACLIVLGLIGSATWYAKAFFCGSMVLLLGTFPRYQLSGKKLEREFFLVFRRVQHKSWRLVSFEAIETDLEFQLPFWTIIFLGWNWLLVKMLDALVPWLGGRYRILLRDYKGQRVLAWQGNGEASFRANLQTLEDLTGLPVERR
jgi:hypothetical protein